MCSMKFELITSRATGTGMLVNRVITLKDTRVPSSADSSSPRDFANPLLSLTNEKLFPQCC